MKQLKSYWRGEEDFASTFWIGIVFGTIVMELIHYGFITAIYDKLNVSFICEIDCNSAVKWISINISYFTIHSFTMFLKVIYIIFATVGFWRSASKKDTVTSGGLIALAMAFWMILVPVIIIFDLMNGAVSMTYGSEYARASY